MNFDTSVYWEFLFNPQILQGVKLTITLSILAQFFGILLGTITAVARLSTMKFPLFRWIAWVYIWLFRGTPLLVQLAFAYFAVPQMTHFRLIPTAYSAALVTLSLNEGSYMAEIVRAGITSVDPGQMEAALANGMTRGQAMRRIVIPQAIRTIIPPTGNEFISMLKNTSLVAFIALVDLFYQAQLIYESSYGKGATKIFELLAVAATWYLFLTTIAMIIQSQIERHYGRAYERDARRGHLRALFFGRNYWRLYGWFGR